MSEAPLLIRPAGETDIEPVRALLRATWHQVYDPILGVDEVDKVSARWHAAELLTGELHAPRSSFLVAWDGDRLVGHGFAAMRANATLFISRLYVRESSQRQGIGRRILAALVARHQEAATLHLFAAAANTRGLAFWRREGFTVVGEAIEEGALVLHMEKRL